MELNSCAFPLDMVSGARATTQHSQRYSTARSMSNISYAWNRSRKSTKYQRIALLSVAYCLSTDLARTVHHAKCMSQTVVPFSECALVRESNDSSLECKVGKKGNILVSLRLFFYSCARYTARMRQYDFRLAYSSSSDAHWVWRW